jgi:hypothetical protein
VYLVFIQGAGPGTGRDAQAAGSRFRSVLSVIPPGTHYTRVAGGWGAMMARPGVEIAFTDRSGVHWVRSADDTVTEIDRPPAEHYGIEGPQDWDLPSSAP